MPADAGSLERLCSRAFWLSLFAGFVLGCAVAFTVSPACAAEHYVGVNTLSHHFVEDPVVDGTTYEYNEENWGVFYEYRWRREWGVQAGYYRNSIWTYRHMPEVQERKGSMAGDSFYAGVIWQPWTVWKVQTGAFLGLATGYEQGLSPLAGLLFTLPLDREERYHVQNIFTPVVTGFQFKRRLGAQDHR